MAKKLLYSLSGVFFLLLVTFLGGNKLLDYSVRKHLDRIPGILEPYGVDVSDPWFQSVAVTGPTTLEWRNIGARLRFERKPFDTVPNYILHIGRLRLIASDTSYRHLSLVAEDIQLSSRELPSTDFNQIDSLGGVTLDGRLFRTSFDSDPSAPGTSLEQHLEKLGQYLTTGHLPVPVEFSGAVTVRVEQRPLQLPIVAVETQDGWSFEIQKDSLEPLARYFKQELTEPELELLQKNPLKVPAMIAAKEYVDRKIADLPEARSHKEVHAEEYRYILWGFVLTKLLGADVAQQAAQAHFAGSTLKSAQQRQSDLENAALGRRYAQENVNPTQLLELAEKEGSSASIRTNWSVK